MRHSPERVALDVSHDAGIERGGRVPSGGARPERGPPRPGGSRAEPGWSSPPGGLGASLGMELCQWLWFRHGASVCSGGPWRGRANTRERYPDRTMLPATGRHACRRSRTRRQYESARACARAQWCWGGRRPTPGLGMPPHLLASLLPVLPAGAAPAAGHSSNSQACHLRCRVRPEAGDYASHSAIPTKGWAGARPAGSGAPLCA